MNVRERARAQIHRNKHAVFVLVEDKAAGPVDPRTGAGGYANPRETKGIEILLRREIRDELQLGVEGASYMVPGLDLDPMPKTGDRFQARGRWYSIKMATGGDPARATLYLYGRPL